MKEIFISKKENLRTIALLEDGVLTEKYEESEKQSRLEGNIYLGKVTNVLPGLQAAFIDIGCKKNTFIHLKDIMPKYDVKKEENNTELYKKNIKEVIRPGMPILVQVLRDATNKKGAKATTHISITSRFLILMPNTDIITISQKIIDEKEKERLIQIVKELLPQNCGAIIRTSAMNRNKEELERDLNLLLKKWNDIKRISNNNKSIPRLIYKTHGIIKKILIDLIDHDIGRIIIDNEEIYNYVINLLNQIEPNNNIEVKLEKDKDILSIYNLREQIEKADKRKIWLKCGGFITIDKTEALTAIDVNSGKYIGNQKLEQTVFLVNKEASIEIAKQLRLKDIGGIIIVDYINMQEEKNKQRIIEILEENLKKDRSKTQVIGFSKLNLLELTRKHICSND